MDSVTCLECKSEIPTGVELCPDCGFNFAETPPVTCPECSNRVLFTGGACPECGFPYEALDELLLEKEQVAASGSRLLKAQAEPLSSVTRPSAPASQLAGLASFSAAGDGHQSEALRDLVESLGSYLEELKQSNGSAASEISAGISRLLEHAEQLKLESDSAMQGMQEAARNISSEVKSVVEGVISAKASGDAAAAKPGSGAADKVSGTVDYIFYICLGMLLFTALNIAVTAYVAKLVK